nr:hypothetical protein [uncultured Rhodopila sp.]
MTLLLMDPAHQMGEWQPILLPGTYLYTPTYTATGTFVGKRLYVSSATGTLAVGNTINGTGVAAGTYVEQKVPDGSWLCSPSQSVSAVAISAGANLLPQITNLKQVALAWTSDSGLCLWNPTLAAWAPLTSSSGGPIFGSPLVDTVSSGTVNDYAGPSGAGFGPGINRVRFNPPSTLTLTGFSATGFADGQAVLIVNESASAINVSQLTGSLAANQLAGATGTIAAGGSALFFRNNSLWYSC